MATRHLSFNSALILTLLASAPLAAQSGIAWPRPNHLTTSLVLAPWYGGTRHQSAHQVGVRAELNWFDSTGMVPAPPGIGFGLGAALFAGRGERQDGFGLYTSASVQLSDHIGSWTSFGKR
ncbi:MAG TPA: hypothetical protein VK864_20650, partial [Longimicrobiales bacterium]|nr:hypothetical protein [Longimicrobiales bacterium]